MQIVSGYGLPQWLSSKESACMRQVHGPGALGDPEGSGGEGGGRGDRDGEYM